MYQVTVTLEGVAPYIQNNPLAVVEDVKNSSGKTRIGRQAPDPALTGYKNKDGFYIPARQIKGMMVMAGRKVKLGKANISNFIKACVFCEEQEIPLLRGKKRIDEPDFIYNDPIIKKTGEMVFNPRVAFKEWRADVVLNVIEEAIPKAKIQEVLEVGGLYTGIGARRPEYGRFIIKK